MTSGLTSDERRELAGRARTLHERLEGPPNVTETSSRVDPAELLDEWRDLFADERSFRERLAKATFTEADVREQAVATHWPADEPLPEWVREVEALIEHVEAAVPGDRPAVACPEDTVFAELLGSIAAYARDRLSTDWLPDAAVDPLVGWLVERLESVSKRALYVEFKSFVEHRDPELARASLDDVDGRPTEHYDAFVDAMFGHGFRNLCLEYPVLARHFARLTIQWIDAVEEACRRLRNDRSTLQRRFDVDGAVTLLEPLGEETHARGRVPFRVSFRSGAVIYKPRPVDAGAVFHETLVRLGDRLEGPSFTAPTYLRRDGYGWMEVVECEPLSSEAAADRYYERVGTLLCVAYVLNFVDCHLEYLIVSGDEPVIVDGETVFHPTVDPRASIDDTAIASEVDRSVLLTNLLPWSAGEPRKDDETPLTAMAGIGTGGGTVALSYLSEPVVRAVNTDVMSVAEETPTVDRRTNTPSVDGEVRPPADHVDAIVRGFERTHEAVRELHERGEFSTGLVDPGLLADVENRLVFRSTIEYGRILEAATERGSLEDGVRLTLAMERLSASFFDGSDSAARYWPIYAAERAALRRLDVPRLASRPDQVALYHDGVPLGVDVDTSGYERCRRRLDAMDGEDLRRQRWLIRRSFRSTVRTTELPPAERTPDRFRETAVELFEGVVDADDGSGWVSMLSDGSAFALVPAGPSLYYGRSGIAVAAAGLYRVTGDERYRALVARALDPVFEGGSTGDRFDLGGFMGLGSVIYALSVAAELLDAETYRARAVAATRLVDGGLLASDDAHDVMAGSAGTLLSLLAHYDRFGGEAVLARAEDCGDRLLERSVAARGHRAWPSGRGDAPLTGFAHGSSGIAYALARLGVTADESRYVEAARGALSFESGLFSPSRLNWARSADESRYRDRWCHGRSGIALSRIATGRLLDDATLLADAEAALSATETETPAPVDHVCCGNFGRVEALLAGSRYTDAPRASAVELASRCLAYREREGSLSLPGHTSSFVNPTFCNGLAGVSYTLLRLEAPADLPCVLLLE